MNVITIQPQENPEFAAVQRAGNRAYDQIFASRLGISASPGGEHGNEIAYDAYRSTTTALTIQLKSGTLWLCPGCRRELAPADALCVYCESEERDRRAGREANGRLRHGRG